MGGLRRGLPVGLILLALLLATGQPSSAQPGGRDRTFVTAPDGSVWVVLGGARHRIDAAGIDDAALAGLSEGPAVRTVDDLLARLEDQAGSALVAPEVAPGALNPPAALLGQTPTICQDGIPIALRVVEADWAKTQGRGAGTTLDGSRWVSVVVSATNKGPSNASLYESTQLRDERGRTWTDVAGTASSVHIDYQGLARQRGGQVATDMLSPGKETRVLLVYSVAEDAKRLDLIPTAGGCQGG
jgi:hypothetical protein